MQVDTVALGALPGAAALVYIAQDQSFFAANGLRVNVKDYPTGVATTDALLQGEVDIAWSAEFPFVRKALAKEKISIIAVLSRFSDEYLFGRKACGIEHIADLKGKTIGLPRNTIAEFYLARFLELGGLDIHDVALVDVPPSQALAAMTRSNLDAVVTWERFAQQIRVQVSYPPLKAGGLPASTTTA